MSDPTVHPAFYSCHRKTRYEKRGHAKDAASALRRLKPGLAVEVYKCPECGGFHIAKDRNKRPRMGRAGMIPREPKYSSGVRRETDAEWLEKRDRRINTHPFFSR